MHPPRTVAAATAVLGLCSAAFPLAFQSVQRVSVSATGDESPFGGAYQGVSGDGSRVVFYSLSSTLVPGDTNQLEDVFVQDRSTGVLRRVSVASGGAEAKLGGWMPAISADGRYVAFSSASDDLVPGDGNGLRDIFVHDLQSGTTERASIGLGGLDPDGPSSWPSLSDDGRYVAFASDAANLVAGDTNGFEDVFVFDRVTQTTKRASIATNGLQGDDASANARISGDGRFVLFHSLAATLAFPDGNFTHDVFVHELATQTTSMVSVSSAGVQGNGQSQFGAISSDGRFAVFQSKADNLVAGDTNGFTDVFVRDLQTGQTTRASVNSVGQQASSVCQVPSISGDGRHVVFQSDAANLTLPFTAGSMVIFRHDRTTGLTTLESQTPSGTKPDQSSHYPVLSADGATIVFSSAATDLVPDDTNGVWDVYVRSVSGCAPTVATYCKASTTSIPGCQAGISAGGTPSLAGAASFFVRADSIPGGVSGVAWFGVDGSSQLPLGTQGGLLCVGSPRFPSKSQFAGGTAGTCSGQFESTLSQWIAQQPGLIGVGATVHAFYHFRDPASPDRFGTTDALWFQVCP